MPIRPITRGLLDEPPGPHRLGQHLQHLDRRLPADTRIGDAHALAQPGGPLDGDLLTALEQIRLDHDADNARLAAAQLLAHTARHQGLPAVVLVGVAVRAVDHHDLALAFAAQGLAGAAHARRVVVGALAAAAQDHEAVVVAGRLGDGRQPLFRHAHEVVPGGGGADGVDGDAEAAVCAVFEADREGEARGEFAVELRFGGAGADCAERDQVGQELRRDGVEHLAGDGHAQAGEVGVHLSRYLEALVDFVRFVYVWVVYQALPADCRPGLLEVSTHDYAQVCGELFREAL